jgi:hypothetical protein
MLDTFADFGNIRFNISFHTANPSEYFDLTGQKTFSLDDLRNTIAEIRCRDIPFKMNSVILYRTMSNSAAVADIINFAKENGAKTCKMIELLIVEENKTLFNECLVTESVERSLSSSGFHFTNELERRRTFIDNTGFEVELQKCRCHFGCEECLKKSLTASLDVHGNFWACFSKTEIKYNLLEIGYAETIRKGKKDLQSMFQTYRESSPSLVQKTKMVSGLQQIWFEIESKQSFDDIIAASAKSNTKTFEEYFFKDHSSAEFDKKPQVLIDKLLHNPQNALLIIADISVEDKEGLPVNNIKFFDPKGPPFTGNVEYLCHFLARLGWTLQFTLDLNEQLFRYTGTQYENAQFTILTVNSQQTFLNVDVDNESGMNLAKEFAGRKGVKSLALPYQEIMKSAAKITVNDIIETN